MTAILERGNIFFLYRPRVGEEDPGGRGDIQRLHVVLDPHGGKAMRRMVIGEKRLPGIRGGGEKNWGFVDEVGTQKEMKRTLEPEVYETKTRGKRVLPGERPAAEGVYAIARHDDHNHLAYALELPEKPGEVQEELNIEEEGSFILSVKNPEKGSPPGVGLGARQKVVLPESLQEKFRGRRFIPADPEFLDHEGAEILLVGARKDAEEELGIDLKAQDEDEESSELLRKLRLPAEEHPREPLTRGEWEE